MKECKHNNIRIYRGIRYCANCGLIFGFIPKIANTLDSLEKMRILRQFDKEILAY